MTAPRAIDPTANDRQAAAADPGPGAQAGSDAQAGSAPGQGLRPDSLPADVAPVTVPMATDVEFGEPFDAAAFLDAMPPELRRLPGRPFGRDEQGREIAHGSGRILVGAVRFLQEVVADRAVRAAPAGTEAAELNRRTEGARAVAVEHLVAALNLAIADHRYEVTPEYLLDESHNYSYAFRLFVAEYARAFAGEPDFFVSLGRRSIPGPIIRLARPIGVRGTFAVLPRFTAKYVRTDLTVVQTEATSAIVRWRAASQLAEIAPELHRRYVAYACRTYQGTFAAIPLAGWGLDLASVREIACQLDGAAACVWEFGWTRPAGARARLVQRTAGIGGSLAVLAYLLAGGPGWEIVAIVGATLLPASLVLYGGEARRRTHELRTQQQLLLEQRDVSEGEHDRSEEARAALQQSNLDLSQRVAELMTINDLSLALRTTLDIDALVERSLRAVVTHLRFDRALVLLIDGSGRRLAHGRSVGGTPEMAALVAGLDVPLDDERSLLASVGRSDGPLLFRDVDRDEWPPNRELAATLGVTSFLGTPLLSQGRLVGILAVDNRLSGRALETDDASLVFTVGSLVAGAIETARLYAEVEAQNRALEGRVAERTAELVRASAEAQTARQAAEAASATKSAFLSNVSHELRTPLTSVVGFAHLIRKRLTEVVFPAVDVGDPKVARALRQIDENLAIIVAEGDRLTALINDVLDLAKIEAGRFELKLAPVDPGELVRRATAATAALVEAGGLRLSCAIEPGLAPILADRDRLIQVLINLVSNAVKFTAEGSVAVSARREDASLIVEVADTGIGIAPEDRERVFDEFAQAGDTLTSKPRGTGLGLPICKQIVEQHGGRIWLSSEVGAGTTIGFSIPAVSPRP